MKLFITTLLSLLITWAIPAKAEIPASIKFAAADWCPYTCPSREEPRIVVEYLQQLLKPYHISIEVQYLPWNRAIREVMTGHISGLVTAVPSEAPNLSFTSTATMKYGVCLYSRSSSNWQYTDISSLEDQILGGALNYSYDEVIDSYIEKNKDKSNITFLTGKNKVSRFSSMLTSN